MDVTRMNCIIIHISVLFNKECVAVTISYILVITNTTDPSGRAVLNAGLRPLVCWNCGFRSHRGHGCLSLVSVVCCTAEISVMCR
jgi:hypothetical protein